LLIGILVNSVVEILGLAVIIPFIGLVIQPDSISTNPVLAKTYELSANIGIDTPNEFLMGLGVFLIFAFIFKATFALILNFIQTRFSFSVAHRFSGQMWTHHFSKSFERMRSARSGKILAEINQWPLQFANTFMVGGMLILNESIIICIISYGLLIYNPLVFVSISSILAIGALIIQFTTKKRLRAYSKTMKAIEPRTNTLISDAVRGFLEVITFQASDSVRDAYLKDRRTIFRIASNTTVIRSSPSKLYEVLAVIAVSGSIIIALSQGMRDDGLFELLSLMAISAYRIMPSMSRLSGAIISMRGNQHLLDTMEDGKSTTDDLAQFMGALEHPFCSEVDIDLKDLTLGYESLPEPILTHLHCQFKARKLHAIVGTSGSGKSTLISTVLGLHHPQEGRIDLTFHHDKKQEERSLGVDLDMKDWIYHVGYLSQQPFLFHGTVRENLTLRVPEVSLNESLVLELVERLNLQDCLGPKPLEFQLQEGGNNLSGGQQQRLALLRALQVQRPVLILDEATSALDQELRMVVFDLLRERAASGCNVILVTHDMELASRCDDVLDLSAEQTKN
jgi:ABC-type multidrug transport system fused ATPase/permease subunit